MVAENYNPYPPATYKNPNHMPPATYNSIKLDLYQYNVISM
jgi:hypothetical protein